MSHMIECVVTFAEFRPEPTGPTVEMQMDLYAERQLRAARLSLRRRWSRVMVRRPLGSHAARGRRPRVPAVARRGRRRALTQGGSVLFLFVWESKRWERLSTPAGA
jgi:hypothetical protein